MANYINLQYCVCFGRGDYGEWMDYEIKLTDEEAAIYETAKKLRVLPSEMPELESVLSRAYDEIDVTEDCCFDEDFDPDNWGLSVEFCDDEDYDEFSQEEAEKILRELFASANGNFRLIRLFVDCADGYYQGGTIDNLRELAYKVATETGNADAFNK